MIKILCKLESEVSEPNEGFLPKTYYKHFT